MDGPLAFDTSLAEKVRLILAEQAMLDVVDVTDEATLDRLGLDSLGLVESLFAIEEAFEISIPFNANDAAAGDAIGKRFDISTVGSIIRGVEALIAAK